MKLWEPRWRMNSGTRFTAVLHTVSHVNLMKISEMVCLIVWIWEKASYVLKSISDCNSTLKHIKTFSYLCSSSFQVFSFLWNENTATAEKSAGRTCPKVWWLFTSPSATLNSFKRSCVQMWPADTCCANKQGSSITEAWHARERHSKPDMTLTHSLLGLVATWRRSFTSELGIKSHQSCQRSSLQFRKGDESLWEKTCV